MPLGVTAPEMSKPSFAFEPAPFADLPGWAEDDHLEALRAFIKSSGPVLASTKSPSTKTAGPSPELLAACRAALGLSGESLSQTEAKTFFETRFAPHRVVHDGAPGLLTGYYEPLLEGSRTPGGPYDIPIYRRPPDLVNLVAESERGALAHALTHARQTASGTEPYATRAEIEGGALEGRGLELLWLKDPVDAFFMHIQGSGRIRFPDGEMIRITYDGKNGHPYTSIGRYLIDAGLLSADKMSLDALKVWLKADADRGRKAMWQNASFVFFRELEGREAESPLGVLEIPLSTGRSLAVDTAFYTIGTPIYVSSPALTHAPGQPAGFRRLMIAQDVGSAIRGPERGDIYFGSGDEAGKLAGITKHPGTFFALIPRPGDAS
jgi:membrane-bound lytic murein transglycosylase A